jgi:hypothetical protein
MTLISNEKNEGIVEATNNAAGVTGSAGSENGPTQRRGSPNTQR